MAWKAVGAGVSKTKAKEMYVALVDAKAPGWRGAKPKL